MAAETGAANGFYRQIVERAAQCVWLLDPDGVLVYCNPYTDNFLGYGTGALVGRSFFDLLHEDDRGAAIARYEERRQGISGTYEARVRRSDSTHVWVLVSATALVDPDGRFAGAIDVLADISRRKQVEQRLLETASELERRNEELQAFAYVASHDLQEPLRMVTSYVQLLQRQYAGKLGESADEFIGYAVTGARRMHALITDLLALSRLDQQTRPPRPCDAGAVAQGALSDLRVAIQEAQARITVEPLPTVEIDPGQLRQVFVNLIGNAVKFRKPGRAPQVLVRAERDDGFWIFSIADDGIGIDPSFYDRIFRVFQRLHPRDEYPGTGIGLAICKKVVERHGGRIWVEGNAAGGATFRFTLPAA